MYTLPCLNLSQTDQCLFNRTLPCSGKLSYGIMSVYSNAVFQNDVQTYNNIKQIPSKSIKYRKNTCYGVEEKGPACSVDSGEASSSINEIHGVISTITRSAVRKGNDAYFSIPRTLIPHHQNNRHHSGWQSNSKPVENESKTVVRETVVMKQNWMEGDEVGVQDVSGTFCAVTTAGALSDMCRLGCENGATVYHRSNDVSLPCCSGTRVARFAEQSLSVSAGRGDELLSTDCRSVDPTSVCLSAASDSVVMWVACDVGASGVANSSVGDTRSSHTGVMASMESSVPSSTGEAVSLTSASLTGDHCSPVCPPVDRSPTLFDEDDDIICDSAVVQSGFLSANRLQPSSFLCAINHPLLSATDLLCRQHKQFCGPYRPPSLTTPTSVRSPCHNTLTLTDSPSPSLLKACLVRKRRVDSDGVPSLCRPATCADTEPITVYGEPTVPCQTMPEPDRPRMVSVTWCGCVVLIRASAAEWRVLLDAGMLCDHILVQQNGECYLVWACCVNMCFCNRMMSATWCGCVV